MTAVRRVWTKTEVLAALEERCLVGSYAVGTKLPSERVLSEEFGVSRPVIREVLRGLMERGYIEIHPGRGSFVRAATPAELAEPLSRVARRGGATARHLVVARLMIETTSTELAAAHASPEALEAMRAALDAHEAARSVADKASTDLAFHEAIAAAADNPLIQVMFGSIRGYVHALMLRSHVDRAVQELGDPIHRDIFDAIEQRDPQGARAAMAEHLSIALAAYGSDLDLPIETMLASYGLSAKAFLTPET